MDIDWDKAPAGATHCWAHEHRLGWRKVVDGEGVFQWNGFHWIKLPGTAELWEATHGKDPRFIKRPEEDPFWKDAPEGTTHHFTNYKGNVFWWIKDLGDEDCQSMRIGIETKWSRSLTEKAWLEDPKNGALKIRNGLAVQQKKEEPPKPTQKVGWW